MLHLIALGSASSIEILHSQLVANIEIMSICLDEREDCGRKTIADTYLSYAPCNKIVNSSHAHAGRGIETRDFTSNASLTLDSPIN